MHDLSESALSSCALTFLLAPQPPPALRASRAAINMMLQSNLNHCAERLVGKIASGSGYAHPRHVLLISEPCNGYEAYQTPKAGDVNV